MSINHGGPCIAVTKKCLNRPDIIIGLQEVSGKAVAEGMRSDTLCEPGTPDCFMQRFLYIALMQVITPQFFFGRYRRQRLLREKPLPDEIFCSLRIFLFEQIIQKSA